MTPPRYALKLVREDYGSLTQDRERVIYTPGAVVTAPRNGIYAAVTGGVESGGVGSHLALLSDLTGPTGADAPEGVICYRSARVVAVIPTGALYAEHQTRWDALYAEYRPRRDALYTEHQTRRAALDAEYRPRWDALDAEYRPRWAALDAEYQPRRDALYAEHQTRWAELIAEYRPRRAALYAEYRLRRAALYAEYRLRWDALFTDLVSAVVRATGGAS